MMATSLLESMASDICNGAGERSDQIRKYVIEALRFTEAVTAARCAAIAQLDPAAAATILEEFGL